MLVYFGILLCFLILLSAFFSGSETALFSLSPLTLRSYRHAPHLRMQRIASLMAHPREVLVTLLMGNILANLLIQNTVSSLFATWDAWSLKVGLPLVLTLVLGEVLPKSIALSRNEALAQRVVPWIQGMVRLLHPVREPLTRLTHWVSRSLFFFLAKEREFSRKELSHWVRLSQEKGALSVSERRWIEGALDLQRSLVKERMRPREEIFFYDIQEPLSQLFRLFLDLELSRIPVCDGHLEQLLGILSTRAFLFQRSQVHDGKDLLPFLQKPYFVPETTKSWALLQSFRDRGEEVAIVVDEYGMISGLITEEDLIEAIVGEISDRRDPKSLYTRSSDDVIIASGKLELSEFREIFGIPLFSQGNVVTLGGWLVEQLGDIPQAGTKYATDQFLFYVLAAKPNRVQRIYVRRLYRA
jgi:CBS domain containing-hemolysin-like protein